MTDSTYFDFVAQLQHGDEEEEEEGLETIPILLLYHVFVLLTC